MAGKAKKTPEPGSVDVAVFVPKGQVREGDIKRAALLKARNDIPVGAFIDMAITNASDVKTVEDVQGREYTVTISVTPRRTSDDEPATVDQVLTSLEPLTPEKLAEVTGATEA